MSTSAHFLRDRSTILGTASLYFRSRILGWKGDPLRHREPGGRLVLVEECDDKAEIEAATALVHAMYDDGALKELSALALALVRWWMVGRRR